MSEKQDKTFYGPEDMCFGCSHHDNGCRHTPDGICPTGFRYKFGSLKEPTHSMNKRLEELLGRMVAIGKFPQISASEGHEVVDGVYAIYSKLDTLRKEIDQLKAENERLNNTINQFWEFLPNHYEIETREELTEMAKQWEPQNPLLVALHYIWKREPAVEKAEAENTAQLAELTAISDALGTREGHSSVRHIEALKAEVKRLHNVLENDVMCLCAEGVEFLSRVELAEAIIRVVNKALQASE